MQPGYPKHVGGVDLPTTAAARAAYELAGEFLDGPLFNHSARTYAWAAFFAQVEGIPFDDELLFVASMLHDLALHDGFDAHVLPFEVMGGNVAVAFAHGAGWSRSRRGRVAEVIRLHMMEEVAAATDPAGYLIQAGVSADVSGTRVGELPPGLVREVLAVWHREGFRSRFVHALHDQAARKPASAAADALAGGIERRMSQNPLDD